MITRLRSRQEWSLFAVLPRADLRLTIAWWSLLMIGAALPAVFAVVMGFAVGAVQRGASLAAPLAWVTVVFVAMQVIGPIQQAVSMNLGNRVSAWLNDELTRCCVTPPGIGHLEDPTLADDLVTAREFDRGMTGPPMFLNIDFLATGLLGILGGLASAVVLAGLSWWAPLVLLLAWGSTHWLLRESAIWRDRNTDEVRMAQRHADYAYRLAVDPAPAKELRLFGLAGWAVQRFISRQRLYELQYRATRLREKSVLLSLLIVVVGNGVVFSYLAVAAGNGTVALDRVVVFAQVALGVSLVAFGEFYWALDGAASPVAAVLRLRAAMAKAGALPGGPGGRPPSTRAHQLRWRDLSFHYPGQTRPVFSGLDLLVPAGSSLAIVGQNGAGKTTLAKLLCRLYDPVSGAIEVDGIDLRDLDLAAWRSRLTAVFQDFVRFELTLRENVDPTGRAEDADILAALRDAGADQLVQLDRVLSTGYAGGTDLSGGQWQRVALARALCAVRLGAGVVLLDEPTAQLDVRGEAAVFERVLAATQDVTTILISHRFSTVRHVDRICVLEGGRVIELGSHQELMDLGGRYQRMFDLQARRFESGLESGPDSGYQPGLDPEVDASGVAFDVL